MNNVYNRTFKANGCISMFFKKEINFSYVLNKIKDGNVFFRLDGQFLLKLFIYSLIPLTNIYLGAPQFCNLLPLGKQYKDEESELSTNPREVLRHL
mgnify:CR=1 FL=1